MVEGGKLRGGAVHVRIADGHALGLGIWYGSHGLMPDSISSTTTSTEFCLEFAICLWLRMFHGQAEVSWVPGGGHAGTPRCSIVCRGLCVPGTPGPSGETGGPYAEPTRGDVHCGSLPPCSTTAHRHGGGGGTWHDLWGGGYYYSVYVSYYVLS